MARKILFLGTLAACSGGEEPPAPTAAMLLTVESGDTEIIERTGKTVSVVGPITVDGTLLRINMPGTDQVNWTGRYIQVTGSPGYFDFLHDGSSKWTIEMLCQFTGEPTYGPYLFTTIIPDVGEALGVFAAEVYDGAKAANVQMRGFDSSMIIDMSVSEPVSAWPIDAPGHLAITFDPALSTDTCSFFLNGVRVATADKSAVAPYSESESGVLFIGGNDLTWPSMTGYIYGVRIVKDVLYTGSSYTPPTEF